MILNVFPCTGMKVSFVGNMGIDRIKKHKEANFRGLINKIPKQSLRYKCICSMFKGCLEIPNWTFQLGLKFSWLEIL